MIGSAAASSAPREKDDSATTLPDNEVTRKPRRDRGLMANSGLWQGMSVNNVREAVVGLFDLSTAEEQATDAKTVFVAAVIGRGSGLACVW